MIKAEFFDIFGTMAFLYIIGYSTFALTNDNLPRLWTILLLIVGIAGLVVDVVIVTKIYLIKK